MSFFIGLFFTCITPGPNNILLFTTASNHGYRKCFSFVAGVFVSSCTISLAFILGFNDLIRKYPHINLGLAWFGMFFMFYIAYKTINTESYLTNQDNNTDKIEVIDFKNAILIQLLNPKVILTNLTFINLYIKLFGFNNLDYIIIPCLMSIMGLIGNLIWIFSGNLLKSYLHNKQTLKTVNLIMGLILVTIGINFIAPYYSF